MRCEKCGNSISETAKFCPKCGAKVVSQAKEIKVCPQCGSENPINAKFCKMDGYRFESIEPKPAERPSEPVAEQPKVQIICPKCGTANPLTAKFCRKDGTPLQKAPVSVKQNEELEIATESAESVKKQMAAQPKAPKQAAASMGKTESPVEAGESEKKLDEIICPSCGMPNPLTAEFCKKDGAPLKAQARPAQKHIEPVSVPTRPARPARPAAAPMKEAVGRPSRMWIALSIILVLVLSGGGVGGYLYLSAKKNAANESVLSEHPTIPTEGVKEQRYTPLSREIESAKSSACVDNLKQLSLILGLYAMENRDRFPPIDCKRKNNFIFQTNWIYPEYLTDATICFCPSDPKYDPKTNFRLTMATTLSDGSYGSRTVRFPAGTVHPNCITDQSYIYLGWLVTNDSEAEAFFEVYDKLNPLEYDWNFSVPKGKGNAGGTIINRLSAGVDRFLISDKVLTGQESLASQVPIMWDNPVKIANYTSYHPMAENKRGGNVLYLDGHVELVEFGTKFPMTDAFARMLAARKCVPLDYCGECPSNTTLATPARTADEPPRGNLTVQPATSPTAPTRRSVNPAQLERDLNGALRNEGLANVYGEVGEDLTAILKGTVSNESEKSRAMNIAQSNSDLQGLTNNIEVKQSLPHPPAAAPRPQPKSAPPVSRPQPPAHTTEVDAARLEGEINRALRDAGLGGVTAAVSDDFKVTLKGSVKNAAQKQQAFNTASRFNEIRQLKDMVFVVEQ